MVDISIDRFNGVNLVILSQILKDDGQLLVGQGLHMVLRRVSILGQDVHDRLGGQVLASLFKILCYFMERIFYHHR